MSEQRSEQDLFEELRKSIKDFGEYDQRAYDRYRADSFYFAQRQAGIPRGAACARTCEEFGHDAPRGLCMRCGLGMDMTDDERIRERERKRRAERDEFLASRTTR